MSEATLLEMCRTVAAEMNLPKMGQVIGNADNTVVDIYNSIRKGLERDVYRGNQWVELRRYIEITFDGVTEFWPLPDDHDWLINKTAWDIVNQRPARGALDQYQWQKLTKSQLTIPNQAMYWTLVSHDFGGDVGRKKSITFFPIRDASTTPNFSVAYMTNYYILDADTRQSKRFFERDEDVSVLDSDLIEMAGLYRMLRKNGMGFQAELEEFNAALDERTQKDGSPTDIDMTGPHSTLPGYPNTPGFVAGGMTIWPRR